MLTTIQQSALLASEIISVLLRTCKALYCVPLLRRASEAALSNSKHFARVAIGHWLPSGGQLHPVAIAGL
jgi:hypothetical protein